MLIETNFANGAYENRMPPTGRMVSSLRAIGQPQDATGDLITPIANRLCQYLAQI